MLLPLIRLDEPRSTMNMKVVESSPQRLSLFAFAANLWRRLTTRRPELPCMPLEERTEISRMEGEGGPAPLARPSAP